MKYYDSSTNRLLFIKDSSNNQFWDQHWENSGFTQVLKAPPKHRRFLKWTKKFLKPGAAILEGGCGVGDKVFRLSEAGYDAYGIDFAQKTLTEAKKVWNSLHFVIADVNCLPFPDSSFDGYWSLGVIEHFYDGYGSILSEMHRLLKPQGFLFLTFPQMNILRKLKAKLGKYPPLSSSGNIQSGFYQYAFDPTEVKKQVESSGFRLIKSGGEGTLKNLKDEVWILTKNLTCFLKQYGTASTFLGVFLDELIGSKLGHMALQVYQKK